MKKNNNGVSLMSLVITIIILLIIASMSIYYGVTKNIDTTTSTVSYGEVFEVCEAVSQRALMNKLNASLYPLIGTKLSDASPVTVDNINYGDDWYRIETTEDFSNLSLENVKRSYLVNYITSEVVTESPVTYENNKYYNSTDLKNAINGTSSSVSNDMYDIQKGVNKPVLVKGMVPVKNVNGTWIVTDSSDDEWYDYSQENKIWANVMLMDELTVSGYTNAEIRSTSLSDLKGKVVTNNGSMLVWIPRYSVNSANEIVYSNLLNDYLSDGYSVPEAFKENNSNLTGIWVSKYDVEYK